MEIKDLSFRANSDRMKGFCCCWLRMNYFPAWGNSGMSFIVLCVNWIVFGIAGLSMAQIISTWVS